MKRESKPAKNADYDFLKFHAEERRDSVLQDIIFNIDN